MSEQHAKSKRKRVRDATPSAGHDGGKPPAQPKPQPKPWHQDLKWWHVALVILGLVVVARVGAKSGSDDAAAPRQGLPADAQQGAPPPAAAPTPPPQKKAIALGEEFALGDFSYVVQQATAKDVLGNDFVKETATEGALFLIVEYTIKNNGNKTETVLTDDFRIIDSRGREFRPSSRANTALAMSGQKDLILAEVQPGLKRSMATAFEVPEDALRQGFKLVIPEKGMLGTGKVEIALALK